MSKGLGKGLDAFFPSVELKDEDQIRELELTSLRPNPYQPRKKFSQASIKELTESIASHGVLQPIIVRQSIKGYEIVVGERRFRAATEAGMITIPAVIRDLDEQKMMELALIENVQRENLNPIEEATAYHKLMGSLDLTQDALAQRLGKSRPHIANHVRLLHLPEEIQDMMAAGELTMGHARALLGIKSQKTLNQVAERVKKEKMNVRQLEHLIKTGQKDVSRETKKRKQPEKNAVIREKEAHLRETLGTAVNIQRQAKKGKIEISFYSDDDLNRVLDIIEGS